MMENIIISKALESEWEDAMEVVWKTFLKFEAPLYHKEGVENFLKFISDEKLFKMFQNGDYITYVAKENGRIVGVASLRSGNHISLLFVEEKYHKRGIARALLKRLQECVEENKRTVILTVNAAPCAVGFYERVGFVKKSEMQTADGITFLPMELLKRIQE